MRFELPRISAAEFAVRAVTGGGPRHWSVLVVDQRVIAELAAGLRAEMESLGDGSVEVITRAGSAAELYRLVRDVHPDAAIVISGVEHFDDAEWRHLDLLRSRLVRRSPVALVVSESSLDKLSRAAPNLASWIGGAVWFADAASDGLSDDERRARLTSLREWSGLSDAELIRRAHDRTLPTDPEYVEWLVLLGREDLIGHQ